MGKAPLSQTLILTEDGSLVTVKIDLAVTIPPLVTPTPTPAPSPSISFAAATATIAEGDTDTKTVANTLSLTRDGITGDRVINLAYSGTATAGSDYVAGPASVTVPAGQTSVSFSLTINGDTVVEADETILITATLAGYAGATAAKTITLANDDVAPPASLSAPQLTKTSGAGVNPLTFSTTLPDNIDHTVNKIRAQRTYVESSPGVPQWSGASPAFVEEIIQLDENMVEGKDITIAFLTAPMPSGKCYVRLLERNADGSVESPASNVVSDTFVVAKGIELIAEASTATGYANPADLALALPAGRCLIVVATTNAYPQTLKVGSTTYNPVASIGSGNEGAAWFDVVVPAGGVTGIRVSASSGIDRLAAVALTPEGLGSYSGASARLSNGTYRNGGFETDALAVTGLGLCAAVFSQGANVSPLSGTQDVKTTGTPSILITHRTEAGTFKWDSSENYLYALAIDLAAE